MKNWSRLRNIFLVIAVAFTTIFLKGMQMIPASDAKAAEKENSKILIAYFGRYGNTNFDDNVDATTSASLVGDGAKKRGMTEMVARFIQKETGGDLFRIQTKSKYPTNFDKLVDQNHKELEDNVLPELKKKVNNMNQYHVVFLGYPIWAVDTPQVIKSFIKEHNLEGKTIIPFCTHEGSGQSGTYTQIRKLCSGADTLTGFSVEAGKVKTKATKKRLKSWLEKIDVKTRLGEAIPITIKAGNQTVKGVCYNTALGEQIMSQFPLTVSMDEFGNREYYGDMEKKKQPTKRGKGKLAFVDGDITYCFENDTMAIFYNQSDNPDLTMRVHCIGRVTSDLSIFQEMDDSVTMTFNLDK